MTRVVRIVNWRMRPCRAAVTWCVVLGPILAVTATAQQPAREAPPPVARPADFVLPATRTITLSNGLHVTMAHYGSLPKVAIRLVVKTGEADEATNERGLANLTRDMMLEGTTSRSARQIAEDAARYGTSVDIRVSEHETSASADVLSEFGPGMLGLIADIVRNPSLPSSELSRIKTSRIRQLSISGSRQQVLAQQHFLDALYPSHPYGRPLPSAATISGYTAEQVRAYHRAHFGARGAHLYVVGVFDEPTMERAIRQALGDWSPGTVRQLAPPTPRQERAVFLLDRPGARQTTLYIGVPVIGPTSPDYVPLLVTNALLGGAFRSRITNNIRESKGYTYSPVSQVVSLHGASYWVEVADVTTNVTGAAIREIFSEISRLRDQPPPADELKGIRNYLTGSFVLGNSSRRGIINQLDFVDMNGLSEGYLRAYVRNVDAVTAASVQQITQRYIDPARMTIVAVGDRAVIESQLTPYGAVQAVK